MCLHFVYAIGLYSMQQLRMNAFVAGSDCHRGCRAFDRARAPIQDLQFPISISKDNFVSSEGRVRRRRWRRRRRRRGVRFVSNVNTFDLRVVGGPRLTSPRMSWTPSVPDAAQPAMPACLTAVLVTSLLVRIFRLYFPRFRLRELMRRPCSEFGSLIVTFDP